MHRAYIKPIKYYRTKVVEDFYQRESLCSFIVRIARDHLVPVDVITGNELAFQKRVRGMSDVGIRLLLPTVENACLISAFLQKTNATASYAGHYTFSNLSALLARGCQSLIRSTKSWCPRCYQEDLKNGFCYDRLEWGCRELSYCQQHYCELVNVCTSCGSRQSYLNESFPIGYCDCCGRFLGLEHYYVKPTRPLAGEMKEFAARCALGDAFAVERCREMAAEMLQHLGEQGLANRLGVPRNLVDRYLHGEHKPQFVFCVQIVAEYEAMAARLARPCTQPETPLREFDTEFSTSVDIEAIRLHLKRILSGDLPPSMREEIAEVFGVSSVFLGIHFPDECNQITVMRRMATISRGGTEAMKGHLRRAIQQVKREGHQLKWESVLASMPTDVLKSARTRDIMKAYYDISRKVSSG